MLHQCLGILYLAFPACFNFNTENEPDNAIFSRASSRQRNFGRDLHLASSDENVISPFQQIGTFIVPENAL